METLKETGEIPQQWNDSLLTVVVASTVVDIASGTTKDSGKEEDDAGALVSQFEKEIKLRVADPEMRYQDFVTRWIEKATDTASRSKMISLAI